MCHYCYWDNTNEGIWFNPAAKFFNGYIIQQGICSGHSYRSSSQCKWEFTLPVIEAGSDQQLEFRFDDFSGTSRTFGYTLVHCDENWMRSNLSPQEYLSGYGQGLIREKTSSFNTTFSYIHYRLVFPEEECRPIISGNYALVVYNEDHPDEIVLTRRFYVTEKSARLRRPFNSPVSEFIRKPGNR